MRAFNIYRLNAISYRLSILFIFNQCSNIETQFLWKRDFQCGGWIVNGRRRGRRRRKKNSLKNAENLEVLLDALMFMTLCCCCCYFLLFRTFTVSIEKWRAWSIKYPIMSLTFYTPSLRKLLIRIILNRFPLSIIFLLLFADTCSFFSFFLFRSSSFHSFSFIGIVGTFALTTISVALYLRQK